MNWLWRLLGVEADPRTAALAERCDLLLEHCRKRPECVAALGRAAASFGVTAEEAGDAFARFGRQGDLTTRRESVV